MRPCKLFSLEEKGISMNFNVFEVYVLGKTCEDIPAAIYKFPITQHRIPMFKIMISEVTGENCSFTGIGLISLLQHLLT